MVTLRLTQERTGIVFQLKPTSTPLGGILALFKVQAWTCVIFGCVTIHVLTSRPGKFRIVPSIHTTGFLPAIRKTISRLHDYFNSAIHFCKDKNRRAVENKFLVV